MDHDNRSAVRDNIAVEDAVNVVNVINDCLVPDADDDVRELAVAAKRLVHHVADLSLELERERARRRAPAGSEARLVDGHRLNERTDGGLPRVEARPISRDRRAAAQMMLFDDIEAWLVLDSMPKFSLVRMLLAPQ